MFAAEGAPIVSQEPADPGATGPPASQGQQSSLASQFWAIPLAAFVVGLVLGGVIVALTGIGPGSSDDSASPSTSTTPVEPTPTSSTAADVVIPGDCVQVAQESQALLELAQQAAAAARDLDADRLSTLVGEIKDQQDLIQAQAAACAAATTESPSPTASP